MTDNLFDFAVATIFAREVLEAAIIIGEYRTIVIRGDSLQPGVKKEDAMREIRVATAVAVLAALVVIAAIAIPLAVLSNEFDSTVSNIIEGVSKIVAAISLLGLSLKLPKWLGVLGSSKKQTDNDAIEGLSLRSIRFNVAWNIWREVAECGVFLIPFFLTGEGVKAIPLSAVVGSAVGFLCGMGIYWANRRFTNKIGLTIFAVLLLVFLSTGLFSGGCHKMEIELGETMTVWQIHGDFWSVQRLPMTIFKPFGYTDKRTLLEILCFWLWLAMSILLHYRKYRISPKVFRQEQPDLEQGVGDSKADPQPEAESGTTIESIESYIEGDNGSRLSETASRKSDGASVDLSQEV
jgi:high-affinity iron transporter